MKILKETKGKIGIYCIQNNLNSKRYVGSSLNIYNRLMTHRSYLRKNKHSNSHLQNSYNKNKEKNFSILILEYCKAEELTEREQYYINLFASEYNLVKDVIRHIPTKAMRKKHSITKKKMYRNKELVPNCIKTIEVYNLKGEKVYSFSSIAETSEVLKMPRSSIKRSLNKQARQMKGYIFIHDRELKLEDLIFPMKGDKIIVLNLKNKDVYFRSQARCAKYLSVPTVSIEKFFSHTERKLFKNKFKLGLIKYCELLEYLEADNQQPSSVEIH